MGRIEMEIDEFLARFPLVCSRCKTPLERDNNGKWICHDCGCSFDMEL